MNEILLTLLGIVIPPAYKKLKNKLGPSDLQRNLSRVLKTWAQDTSESYAVEPNSLFPLETRDKTLENLPATVAVREKTSNNQIPEVSDFVSLLLDVWRHRKEVLGQDASELFLISEEEAIPYLSSLATNIHHVYVTDTEFFRTTVYAKLSGRSDPPVIADLIGEKLETLLNQGNFNDTLDLISQIRAFRDVQLDDSIRELLVLSETQALILLHRRDRYRNQITLLLDLSPSYLKYHFLLILTRHYDNNLTIGEFIATQPESKAYEKELTVLFSASWGTIDDMSDVEFKNFNEDARSKLAEAVLGFYANNYKNKEAEALIHKQKDYLKGNYAKFIILAVRYNTLLEGKNIRHLRRITQIHLNELLNSLNDISFLFHEINEDSKSSYNFLRANIANCLGILAKHPEYLSYLDNESLVLSSIQLEKALGQDLVINRVLARINDYGEKVREEVFDYLFSLGLHNRLNESGINDAGFDKTDKLKLEFSGVVAEYLKGSDSTVENLTKLEHNYGTIPLCNLLISNMYAELSDMATCQKYFERVKNEFQNLTQEELIRYAELASGLEDAEQAEAAFEVLIRDYPQYVEVYIRYLLDQNRWLSDFEHNKKLSTLFSKIKIDGKTSADLLRMKSDFLQRTGEKDKAIALQREIAEIYDLDSDWVNLLMLLVDYRRHTDLKGIEARLSAIKDSSMLHFSKFILFLFKPGLGKEARMEAYTKHFFQYYAHLTESKKDVLEEVAAATYMTIVQNNFHIEYEKPYIDHNSIVHLRKKTGDDSKVMFLPEKDFVPCQFPKKIPNFEFVLNNDEIVVDPLYKNIGDELDIDGGQYEIERIDYLINFPLIYLNSVIMRNPERYGVQVFEDSSDPIADVFPKLLEQEEARRDAYEEYKMGRYSFYALAGFEYSKYLAVFHDVFSSNDKQLNAGSAHLLAGESRYVLGYQSLILLVLFDKISVLPMDSSLVTKSLITQIENFILDLETGKDVPRLSLALDKDSLPVKYESAVAQNLASIKQWKWLLNHLRQNAEIVDVTDIEDDMSAYTKIIGKLEIDSIRAATKHQLPLVSDDILTRQFALANQVETVTNVVSVYFNNRSEEIREKISFINDLSNLAYRFVIFDGLLKSAVTYLLNNTPILVGPGTLLSSMLELLGREMKIIYPDNLNRVEFAEAFELLITGYLSPASEELGNLMLGALDDNLKKSLKAYLIQKYLYDESRTRFLLTCFSG